jgi:hypothetical protein
MHFQRRLLLAACFLFLVTLVLAGVLRRPIGEELFERAAAARANSSSPTGRRSTPARTIATRRRKQAASRSRRCKRMGQFGQ